MLLLALIRSVIGVSTVVAHSLAGHVSPGRVFINDFIVLVVVNVKLLLLPHTACSPLSVVSTLFVSIDTVYIAKLSAISVPAAFAAANRVLVLFLVRVNNVKVVAFAGFFKLVFANGLSDHGDLVLGSLMASGNSSHSAGVFTALHGVLFVAFLIRNVKICVVCSTVPRNAPRQLFVTIFSSMSTFYGTKVSLVPGKLRGPTCAGGCVLLIVLSVLVIVKNLNFPVIFGL